MNYIYLLPFSYFAKTRLAKGSLAFHALFEWVSALVLAAQFGVAGTWNSIFFALGAYFAFISLYEVGYLFNDLVASKKENAPHLRGPQGAKRIWFVAWVFARLFVFAITTNLLGVNERVDWWLFFAAMGAVFSVHNSLHDKESKAATFLWLAWFRFLAPVVFVVDPSQRMGIAMGAASLYSVFRLFGYLDSKGLLSMPNRKSTKFRTNFFFVPLSAALATFEYSEATAFRWLVFYFALISSVAYLVQILKMRLARGR